MKRDIIVFGEDWNSLPSSTQHLTKYISSNRRIIWINSIGLRKPRFSIKDMSRMLVKIFHFSTALMKRVISSKKDETEKGNKNIFVYNLLSIPAPKTTLERYIVKKLLAHQLKVIISRHSFSYYAIWTSLPTASDLKDEFPDIPYIYYCGDDFNGLSGVDHKSAMIHENKIAHQSDLILASSKNLVCKFSNDKCKYLPHGVDIELFSTPTIKARDLPDNGKPVAGFYGSIEAWIDLSLLEEVIRKTPEWDFVFIGESHINTSRIEKFSNTYFLGPKPHAELPRYSQHWQVSLLPFINNLQIKSCNPLKLKEYLASGTPIISTHFPAAVNYSDNLTLINSSQEMCLELKKIGCNRFSSNHKKNLNSVISDSWSIKANQVEEWIDEL